MGTLIMGVVGAEVKIEIRSSVFKCIYFIRCSGVRKCIKGLRVGDGRECNKGFE